MRTLRIAVLITLLAVAMTGTASASILATGSISFVNSVLSPGVGAGPYTGANLSTATLINLDNLGRGLISSSGGDFMCPKSNCVPALGDSLLSPPINIETTAPASFTAPLGLYANFLTFGDNTIGPGSTRYHFTVTSSTVGSTGPNELTVQALGTFHDDLGFYSDNVGALTLSLTQTGGVGTAVSLSGTFSTTAAPEPTTLVLFGGALVALGVIRRKKA